MTLTLTFQLKVGTPVTSHSCPGEGLGYANFGFSAFFLVFELRARAG